MGASRIKPLGNARELLWDMERIETLAGKAALTLHRPEFRDPAIVHDQPWEGSTCCYHTGSAIRSIMVYYRGGDWREGKAPTGSDVLCRKR